MDINYAEMILALRVKLNISQQQLGDMLGVSFSTVNRWENGKYEPTKLAKAKLRELFKQYNVEEMEE